MFNELLFTKIEEKDIASIWFQQDGATKLHLMFCTLFLKIALSAAELMSFGHLAAAIWHLWTIIYGEAVKDKCYIDKPETIDVLKDSIREAIGEIQLHTIDNMLKNWTNRGGYCMAKKKVIWRTLYKKIIAMKIFKKICLDNVGDSLKI